MVVYSFVLTLTVLVGQAGPKSVETAKDNRARMKDYYSSWVGVAAPELGENGLDHDNKQVPLTSFLGKRVLLFSFDGGNFNRAPDEKALLATLRAVEKARKTVGRDKLAVVGFTQGLEFVWPGAPKPEGELGRLSDFAVISAVSSVMRKFNEPYNLLLRPSAVVIDRRGIIRAVYDHPLSERELLEAVTLGDWDKPVRPAPVEDPWAGKGPPKPTLQAAVAWSRTVAPNVVGMTAADWDLRGDADLIAAVEGALVVIDPEDGKERHRFASREFSGEQMYKLRWARVGKAQSAVFITYSGWPHKIPIIGRDGASLWKLPEFPGIDDVAWADLDGAGSKTLIVGLNGGAGLWTFVDGRSRWRIALKGNVWTVAGIDAIEGRPGRVIYSTGDTISVVDSHGGEVGTISTDGHGTTKLAASEMDSAGERQVVAIWPAIVGTGDYAVGTDLQGKVLWKYPINVDEMSWMESPILAADVTGDGTKEWILAPRWRELVVLDTRGHLVARIEPAGNGWAAWTAIERKGKPGWVVASEPGGNVSAFTLSAKN